MTRIVIIILSFSLIYFQFDSFYVKRIYIFPTTKNQQICVIFLQYHQTTIFQLLWHINKNYFPLQYYSGFLRFSFSKLFCSSPKTQRLFKHLIEPAPILSAFKQGRYVHFSFLMSYLLIQSILLQEYVFAPPIKYKLSFSQSKNDPNRFLHLPSEGKIDNSFVLIYILNTLSYFVITMIKSYL